MTDSLLLVHAFATWFLTGLIWTIQLVHYPLFARIGERSFRAYEDEHARRITWIVAPAMGVPVAGPRGRSLRYAGTRSIAQCDSPWPP